MLQHIHPEDVEVEICRADKLVQRHGLTSELDEMQKIERKHIKTHESILT